MPPESGRRLPSRGLIVHARGDGADLEILGRDGGLTARDAVLDRAELAAVDPLKHVDLPHALN